jgi:hypothetical protein
MGVQRTDDYLRPRGYYDNPGTLLTADFQKLNNILYGSGIVKYAIGTTTASNGMILNHGLNSSFACFVNPTSGTNIACGSATGSQIEFYVSTRLGTATSAVVNWLTFGY